MSLHRWMFQGMRTHSNLNNMFEQDLQERILPDDL